MPRGATRESALGLWMEKESGEKGMLPLAAPGAGLTPVSFGEGPAEEVGLRVMGVRGTLEVRRLLERGESSLDSWARTGNWIL